MQEQEIFQHYELKNWELSPRIYKILAASAIFNILLVVVLAQANFLTAKSCDTPLMSEVCSVFDTLYVGSMILDTDTGYVNEEYVKTELEDADITFIDLSGQTPLEYPAGYFAVANPETVTDPTMVVSTELGQNTNPNTEYIPGITGNTRNPTITNNTPKSNPTFKPQVTPKQNPNATVGELPKDKKNPTTTTENQTTENQTTKDQTTAQTDKQNQKVESEPVKEVSINKKPMQDFADTVVEKKTKNEVDLSKSFLVVMEGYLTKDGKLDKEKSKYVKAEGDEQIINIAKEAIEAVSDSGWFGYLKLYDVEKVTFTLVQDDKQIYAVITSDQKTEERAKTISSGFNGILAFAKNGAKDQSDEKILLSNAKVTSQGKSFTINFTIPKEVAQEMINRKLQEALAKKNQSNTETQNGKSNQTADK